MSIHQARMWTQDGQLEKWEAWDVHVRTEQKNSLSPYDDKRYILGDGYSTRAHGHWRNQVPREEPREDIEGPSAF